MPPPQWANNHYGSKPKAVIFFSLAFFNIAVKKIP